jgi:hypothetical protein
MRAQVKRMKNPEPACVRVRVYVEEPWEERGILHLAAVRTLALLFSLVLPLSFSLLPRFARL